MQLLKHKEQLNYCKNALYTFVKYCEEGTPAYEGQGDADDIEEIPEEECFTDSCTRLTTFSAKPSQNASFKSVLDSNSNLLADVAQQVDEETRNEHDVQTLLEERTNFIEQCKDDPLYTNPQFPQPWKVLSKISHSIVCEIIDNFESDLSFGEESYVRDFINMEMET